MKKSLIAVAVAAALPAFAHAQSNVQLYGIMDLGIGYKDVGGDTDGVMVVDSGFQSTSRWGIRGSENLGGGLTATFNLESGIGADTGDSANGTQMFARRSVVGLKGGWGEVNVGRDYTPGFSSAGTTDIMGYSFLGNWLNFTAGTTQGTAQAGAAGILTRASNGIFYKSPAFGNVKCLTAPMSTECNVFGGGFSFSAMWATGENNTPGTNAGDAYGGAAVYKGGPLSVQGYWQRVIASVPALNSGDIDVDQYGAGAGWNFGLFRLAFNYGQAKASAAAGDLKNTAWALGGAVKVGPGELLVNYIDREVKIPSDKYTGSTWGIAYNYPFSKRTNLYATWGMTNNDSGAAFRLNYSQSFYAPSAPGEDVMGFAVGVRHLF